MTWPLTSSVERQRERMVAEIRKRDVHDDRVLEAMRQIPREAFVPADLRDRAYEDCALPIGEGQTISQPYVVALMLELARLDSGSRVLDVGTGSGYAAVLLSRLAGEVYTIERQAALFESARAVIERLGCTNVHCRLGDGSHGWREHAPFDAIVTAAGTDSVPEELLEQLKIGGRLVLPVGSEPSYQRLLRITRIDQARYDSEDFGPVSFVPLVRDGESASPE
jgi:protein-L-isoaspartate(D-aspartate) O-methyltransferase